MVQVTKSVGGVSDPVGDVQASRGARPPTARGPGRSGAHAPRPCHALLCYAHALCSNNELVPVLMMRCARLGALLSGVHTRSWHTPTLLQHLPLFPGPVCCALVQAGIVSYGPDDCGGSQNIGAYTDVAKMRAWIDRKIKSKKL